MSTNYQPTYSSPHLSTEIQEHNLTSELQHSYTHAKPKSDCIGYIALDRMLASRCCRIAASAALRRASRAARTIPTDAFLSHIQARTILSARISQETRISRTLQYSTASNTASDAANPPDTPLPEKPDYLNDAESAIWDRLAAEFSPTELMVQDISGGCGSMYGIEITSEKFRDVTMLKQQRMVIAVLGDDMKSWHGVQIRTRTPS
ncbi:bola protein [Xylaria sp. FL1042]|nr:bola protein [Xylaria sp. FL1042]